MSCHFRSALPSAENSRLWQASMNGGLVFLHDINALGFVTMGFGCLWIPCSVSLHQNYNETLLFPLRRIGGGRGQSATRQQQRIFVVVLRDGGETRMIVRMWHGRVPTNKAEPYRRFLNKRPLPDYRSVAGN